MLFKFKWTLLIWTHILILLSLNYGKEGKGIKIIESTSLVTKDGWIYAAAVEM